MNNHTTENAELQYTRAQARSDAGHADNWRHTEVVRSSNQARHSLADPSFESRSPLSSRSQRQQGPSQRLKSVLNFGSDAVIYTRKLKKNSFENDPGIPGLDHHEHQTRGRSPSTTEIFESESTPTTFFEDALRREMSQRGFHRANYQRMFNNLPPRSQAGPSERELFVREKYLFIKERAMFLRERQSFMIEKEQFLIEKQELLRRRADTPQREPAQTADTVRSSLPRDSSGARSRPSVACSSWILFPAHHPEPPSCSQHRCAGAAET
jgi:hypothetical protein